MPVGIPKGRAPRIEDADADADGTTLVSAVRRAQSRVPDLFKARGRGCAAVQLSPTARPRRTWASVFAGAKSRLWLPSRQSVDWLGAVLRPSWLGASNRDTADAYPHA